MSKQQLKQSASTASTASTPFANSLQQSRASDGVLFELVADVLKRIRHKGASQAEVAASMSKGFSTTVRMGEVDTVEHHRDKGFAITVYFGQHKGQASSSDLSPAAINEAVDAACSIAQFIEPDPYVGLADAELMCDRVLNLDLYHPASVTPEQAIDKAKACEAVGLAVDKRISNSEGATFSSGEGEMIYANSHGFSGAYSTTRYSLSCCLLAQTGNGMQRDYEYTTSRVLEKCRSEAEVAQAAAEKTLARLDARRLTTRQAPVLFTPELARGLLASFVSAISGGNLYRKTSFLLDSLGKVVMAPWMHVYEQAHLPQAFGSSPFDNEGVATVPRRVFVEDGVLQSYVLSSYSARRLGLQTTANAGGVHNLTLAASAGDRQDLLNQMGTGLLVTELIGHGVNLVTGDYSRGAAGFWVENGQIQYPVHEITIAGNLKDMFARAIAAGNDIDCRGGIRSGSLLLDSMTIAGK